MRHPWRCVRAVGFTTALLAWTLPAAHAQLAPHHEYPTSAHEQDGPDPHDFDREREAAAVDEAAESLIGWTPDEGFRMRSKDGNYKLRLSLQVGMKVEPAWTEGDHVMNGTFAFLRPILRGNLFRPWLLYRLSLETAR